MMEKYEQSYVLGEKFNLLSASQVKSGWSRNGYDFSHWYDDSGTHYAEGWLTSFTVAEVNLSGSWNPHQFTLSANNPDHGSITLSDLDTHEEIPLSGKITYDQKILITGRPDSGYKLNKVTIKINGTALDIIDTGIANKLSAKVSKDSSDPEKRIAVLSAEFTGEGRVIYWKGFE